MKLLLEKKGNRGCAIPVNGINIKKSIIYISGNTFNRLCIKDKPFYGNIGINEEGNICLYFSYENNDLLYKFYFPKNKKQARLTMNTKEQMNALNPYCGLYDIKYISMGIKENNITEVVLQKQ